MADFIRLGLVTVAKLERTVWGGLIGLPPIKMVRVCQHTVGRS